LKRVGEMLAVVQGGRGETAFCRKITGSFKGKMIKVAPGAIGGNNNLCMIREVKLYRD
jgi:hypothetical protein